MLNIECTQEDRTNKPTFTSYLLITTIINVLTITIFLPWIGWIVRGFKSLLQMRSVIFVKKNVRKHGQIFSSLELHDFWIE